MRDLNLKDVPHLVHLISVVLLELLLHHLLLLDFFLHSQLLLLFKLLQLFKVEFLVFRFQLMLI